MRVGGGGKSISEVGGVMIGATIFIPWLGLVAAPRLGIPSHLHIVIHKSSDYEDNCFHLEILSN